jgi:L-arabinonolactonase
MSGLVPPNEQPLLDRYPGTAPQPLRSVAGDCYWSAATDGWELVRFTPTGRVDRRIALPVAKPSMLAFGGERLDTIFVTSIRPANADLSNQPLAGSLFAMQTDVAGLRAPLFAG